MRNKDYYISVHLHLFANKNPYFSIGEKFIKTLI